MTLANPTKAEVVRAIKDLDADDEYTEMILAALDKLLPRQAPLVIVWVGGGVVQDWVLKAGVGVPRMHVLDFDREGQSGRELQDFVERITEAERDLAEYGDLSDRDTLMDLSLSIDKFQALVDNDEQASRYR